MALLYEWGRLRYILEPDCGPHAFTFKSSETFTLTENVLTYFAKTRTREGGGRQRCRQGLYASKSAQQTAEEEKDEMILGQAMVRQTTPSWAV